MIVRRLGLVLERRSDALATGRPLDQLYHWREPEELEAMVQAFQALGYTVKILGTPRELLANLTEARHSVDFLVNLSVGFLNRSRLAEGPALYQLAGLPYWGADPYTKMVSQHKELTKSFLDHLRLPTPPWCYVHPGGNTDRALSLGFPLLVKPAFEGSSIGIGPEAVVRDAQALHARILAIHDELGMPVVVEKFIPGREVKVGMVGHEAPRFTGIIEDTLGDGSPMGDQFLYFGAKKAGDFGKIPRDVDALEFRTLLADCQRIYRTFLPLDYATFDVRIDEAGQHHFLEFNADATLHPQRTLAQCAALHDLSYQDLLRIILETAFTRQGLTGLHAR